MTKQTKNILIVSPYFYPEAGGLENYAYQIGKRLAKNNCNVKVVSGTYKKNSIKENFEGIKVIRLKPSFIISNTPIRLNLCFDLINIIKEYKPDIIHAHTPVPYFVDIASLISKIYKIPFVVTYHAGSLKKNVLWLDLISSFYKILEHFTLKRAQKIIAVSNNIKNNTLRKFNNKIEVITPGVDLSVFKINNKLVKKDSFLFVGQLGKSHQWKGLEILLKAIKKVDGAKLKIAGNGNMINYYKKIVKRLEIEDRVKFLGNLEHYDLSSEYQKAIALIIPSVSQVEGCPTVMFESLACATPIIGSNIGGIPTIVKDNENGLLIEPNNVKFLAEKLKYSLRNKEKMVLLGKNGRDVIVKYYSWNKITQKYERIYKKYITK